jgi:hypothetical protein
MTTRRSLLSIPLTLLSGMFLPKHDASPKKETDPVQPGNPIVGGTVLRIPAIQSPNFVSGTSGWSINADGTAEFNGLTLHGSLVLGTGGSNVIVLDFARHAVFVYDNSGNLIASIAPSSGTDALGNAYQIGIVSYFGATEFTQLVGGNIQISTPDPNQIEPFQTFQSTGAGPGGDQPVVSLLSPADSGIPTADTIDIEFLGSNHAGTAAPFLRFRRALAQSGDFLFQGNIKWSNPGVNNWGETWHALPLATNWANTGAPWANGSYIHTADNRVNLGGVIQWNAAASNAPVQVTTALPAAYRPISQHRLIDINMPANTSVAAVEGMDIHTDGTIWITGFANGTGPMTPITLTGLSYPLDL